MKIPMLEYINTENKG